MAALAVDLVARVRLPRARVEYLLQFVVPAGRVGNVAAHARAHLAHAAGRADGAEGAHPVPVGDGAQAHAVGVVAAVASVAKHHPILVVWLAALSTRLAVHALPAIETNRLQQLATDVDARRVRRAATVGTTQHVVVVARLDHLLADATQARLVGRRGATGAGE